MNKFENCVIILLVLIVIVDLWNGYERALKNTPTFPMVSTSPAYIVPDQLQGWRLEENDN